MPLDLPFASALLTFSVRPPYSSPSYLSSASTPAASSNVMKAMPLDLPVSLSVTSFTAATLPHSAKSLRRVSSSTAQGNPPTNTLSSSSPGSTPFASPSSAFAFFFSGTASASASSSSATSDFFRFFFFSPSAASGSAS